MNYHPDDQAEIDRLHTAFIAVDEPNNEQVMVFQDASYALGLKRGQAHEAALQQRLNEADERLDESTHRVRESQAELLEMKASIGLRGFTLGVIGRNDHFLGQLTRDSPEVGS